MNEGEAVVHGPGDVEEVPHRGRATTRSSATDRLRTTSGVQAAEKPSNVRREMIASHWPPGVSATIGSSSGVAGHTGLYSWSPRRLHFLRLRGGRRPGYSQAAWPPRWTPAYRPDRGHRLHADLQRTPPRSGCMYMEAAWIVRFSAWSS
jgi:hypothetical protein